MIHSVAAIARWVLVVRLDAIARRETWRSF